MSVTINEENIQLQVLEDAVTVEVINDDYIVLTISNLLVPHAHDMIDINGLVGVLEIKQDAIHVGTTPPADPYEGQLWLDIS